ncbi:MAG: hypothetical protein FWB91_10615 [Defluviitaleaceae bacterium]|nr:hypothetical protein [Defluviitaleaceae bacterium]
MRKLLCMVFVVGMSLLVGCGAFRYSGDSGRERSQRIAPVEDWTVLMQGVPGVSAFRFETYERAEPPEPPEFLFSAYFHHMDQEAMDRFWEERITFFYGAEAARTFTQANRTLRDIEFFLLTYEEGRYVIPPYFAGALPDFDTGYVTVMIVERHEAEAAIFLNFLADFENVDIQMVPFTIAELGETLDYIMKRLLTLEYAWGRLSQPRIFGRFIVWIDHMQNRVVVQPLDYNEEEKELFLQEVIDSPMVIFEGIRIYN